jgi:ferredoxin-type protein NapH
MRAKPARVGADAIAAKGWLKANRFLLARRASQLGFLVLFMLGPLAGIWIVKGNLSSSLTLGVLPLTDPFVLLQSLVARHWPEFTAILGALLVLGVYLLVGGRAYCSWVCPVNLVTDAAAWLRRRLGLPTAARLPRATRQMLLAVVLIVSAVTGTVAWELVNPVSMFHRGLIFGVGLAWVVILAIFILDAFASPRAWCAHLCPMGAFYALVGRASPVRVRAQQRAACNDCGDCYEICPEPQVIRAPLKAEGGIGPAILDSACTNCGRCIDVCSKDVFAFGTRFRNTQAPSAGSAAGLDSQKAADAQEAPGECRPRAHESTSS